MHSCTPTSAENTADAPAALRHHENFVRHHADGLWRFFNAALGDANAAEPLTTECFTDLDVTGDDAPLLVILYDRAWQLAQNNYGDAPLVKLLQQLPAGQRTSLLLQEYAALAPAEIAAALSIPRVDIERLLADGRSKLKALTA